MNHRIGRAITLAAAFLLIAAPGRPAAAGELAGVSLPDRVEVGSVELVLNGMGLREATLLKVDVYVAGLYLESRSTDGQAIIDSRGPKRLIMRFVRDVKRDDLAAAWSEGFEKNARGGMDALRDRVAALNSWMSDMAVGDSMAFTEVPGAGVKVEVRGVEKGALPGDGFARALWSIWLGPKPPNKGLKTGLLGLDRERT